MPTVDQKSPAYYDIFIPNGSKYAVGKCNGVEAVSIMVSKATERAHIAFYREFGRSPYTPAIYIAVTFEEFEATATLYEDATRVL